jgi:hypothetical protein
MIYPLSLRTITCLLPCFLNGRKNDEFYLNRSSFRSKYLKINGPSESWQSSKEATGWVVPFKYQDPQNQNYNVRIKYSRPNIDLISGDHDASPFRSIEWIEKEYTASGNAYAPSVGEVIEYYKAKQPFDKGIKAKIDDSDFKKISFIYPDGSEIDGFVSPGKNKFIEDEPYAKSYKEGGRRWWIEKSANSKVFDKRRIVSPPRETVGTYDDSYMELSATKQDFPGGPSDKTLKQPTFSTASGTLTLSGTSNITVMKIWQAQEPDKNNPICTRNGSYVFSDNSLLPINNYRYGWAVPTCLN